MLVLIKFYNKKFKKEFMTVMPQFDFWCVPFSSFFIFWYERLLLRLQKEILLRFILLIFLLLVFAATHLFHYCLWKEQESWCNLSLVTWEAFPCSFQSCSFFNFPLLCLWIMKWLFKVLISGNKFFGFICWLKYFLLPFMDMLCWFLVFNFFFE